MERSHDRPFQDFVAHETHRLMPGSTIMGQNRLTISPVCLFMSARLKSGRPWWRHRVFHGKIPKDRRASIFQNTGCDVASVIQSGHLQEVNHASCGPPAGSAQPKIARLIRVWTSAPRTSRRVPRSHKGHSCLRRLGSSRRARSLIVTSQWINHLYHGPGPCGLGHEFHRCRSWLCACSHRTGRRAQPPRPSLDRPGRCLDRWDP